MIKIFWGARGGDTFKPPPSYEQVLLLPTSVLRCFWKDPLMTPTPHPPTSSILHCYPPPHPPPHSPPLPLPPPPPLKNFDHTLGPTCRPGVSRKQTEDPKQALIALRESRRERLLSLFTFQSSLSK